MLRRAPIYAETKASIVKVLFRDHEAFALVPEGNGQYMLFVKNASQRRMKEILTDAACERASMEAGVPVYSRFTLKNPEKLRRLQQLNGTKKFRVYNKTYT